jgi:hypothetical protein
MFWSLSCGADLGKCIHELGGLYDRALRAHALRVGIAAQSSGDSAQAATMDLQFKALSAACDRTLLLTERHSPSALHSSAEMDSDSTEAESTRPGGADQGTDGKNELSLFSPRLWDDVLANILTHK